jgi:predicted alpha/beta-hydrolase family hydrolase
MPDELLVSTPAGTARVVADLASRPRQTVVLGHGAGGGIGARDLAGLAANLPAHRVNVLRVEQPWRVAGGRAAPPPGRLDLAWTAVLANLADRRPSWLTGPLAVGGRSAGARVACRTARSTGADAVLALAFPLHPPGRPEVSRAAELVGAGRPTLVVQGDRDPFGSAASLPAGTRFVAVPYADHGFAVPRNAVLTQREALELVTAAVVRWLRELLAR